MTAYDALQRTLRTFYAQWSVAWANAQPQPNALGRAAVTDTERFVADAITDIAAVLELMTQPSDRLRGIDSRLKSLRTKVPTMAVAGAGLSTRQCTAFRTAVIDALSAMLLASITTTGEQPARPTDTTSPRGKPPGATTRGAQAPRETTAASSGSTSKGQRAKPPAAPQTTPTAPSKKRGGVLDGILGGLVDGVKANGALDGILGGLIGAVGGGAHASGGLDDILGGFRGGTKSGSTTKGGSDAKGGSTTSGTTRGGGGRTRSGPPSAPPPTTTPSSPSPSVGPTSAGAEPPSEKSLDVKAILSVDAPKEVLVGADAGVDVRIEIEAPTAAPLPTSTTATINRVEKIAVIITVHGNAIALVDPFLKLLDAPSLGAPTTAQFAIRGVSAGATDITVQFMQGSTPLAVLRLSLNVVSRATDPAVRVSATADGAPPAHDARDVLSLFIEEQRNGDQLSYRYLLTWDAKDLRYADYSSAPFLDRGSGAGSTPLAYIQSIYKRIVDRALVNYDDLKTFKTEVEGIGLDMGTQLFDNELSRLLWQYRDDLAQISITSKEAYVPWELLVLRNPDARGAKSIDGRHLAERKLLRALRGKQATSTLALKDWRYVVSEFPEGSLAATQSEVPLFTNTLPARGVQAQAIAPNAADVLAAMGAADFDVLHFSGHGLASPDKIDEATLILGDRKKPNGEIETVGLEPATLSQRYDLSERHPVVFLNACETGRQAPSLTNMGGWPKKFLELGASVFVGTSWSVREKPAAAFSRAFYESLLDHNTLADAADHARAAAKKLGDASWLAYTVYGQPSARSD